MANEQTATLGGGCFWCLEAVFDDMEGVISVTSGYMGGAKENPKYEEVCSGRSGHIEIVQVVFDADTTSYREILDVFFAIHDPTSMDRQGNDVGSQYRSAIFYHTDEQREVAEEAVRDLNENGAWGKPIVTEIRPAEAFYAAENYHQDYFRNNPEQAYCAFVVAPKVRKFRDKFADKRKAETPA